MMQIFYLAEAKTIKPYYLLVAACTLLFVSLPSCSRESPHAEALKQMTATVEETITVLKSIHSVDDAHAAQTQLTNLSQRALDTQKKMNSLIGRKIPLESRRYTAEKLEENIGSFDRLMEEASRLQQRNPEALRIIAPSLRGFQNN